MTNNTPNNSSGGPSDRLLDLLAEQAASGLDEQSAAELETLLETEMGVEQDHFDESVSAAAEAFVAADFEPMPMHLRERCIGSAKAVAAEAEKQAPAPIKFEEHKNVRTVSAPAGASGGALSSMGWIAAAACLMLAVVGWMPKPGANPIQVDPWINITSNQAGLAEECDSFIREHAEAIIWEWAKWGDEYAGVTGNVVWDPATNEGYMRFTNLPANDPNVERYQLWIVDQARGTPLQVPPVDGGMFDCQASQGGEWIVHFKARLPVGDAFGFGVTLEGPDGVVVSDQVIKTVIAVAPPKDEPEDEAG